MAEGRTLVGLRAEGWRGARCWPRDRHLCTRLAVVTDAAGPGKTDRGDADRFEKQLRCNITRSAPQPHSREMQANIGRLFVCCTSAPGDGAPDENGHYTSQATPAITKVNDMLLARVSQQKDRDTEEELSPEQTGDEYDELVAEGSRCASREDWRVAAKAFREAIALRPDEPLAYLKLGMALGNSSWHDVEAVQPFLLRRSSVRHRAAQQLRGLHVVPRRVAERHTELEVRHRLVGPQGDGLAEGPGCSVPVLPRGAP